MAQPDLLSFIRDVPDYPKPGILFRDLTPLFGHPEALAEAVRALAEPFEGQGIRQVVGIESRGFVLGAPVALALGAGFVPVRKAGKLPHETIAETYSLEYGTDTVEIHADAISPGERVLLVDDLIATGGTAAASLRLLHKLGADVAGCAVLIELGALGGREVLGHPTLHSLLKL